MNTWIERAILLIAAVLSALILDARQDYVPRHVVETYVYMNCVESRELKITLQRILESFPSDPDFSPQQSQAIIDRALEQLKPRDCDSFIEDVE